MAQTFEKVLTDGWDGVYHVSWQISSDELPGVEGPPWSITKYALRGGKQHGVDVVELDNGELTVVVVPTRGMNVLEAYTEEVTLGWESPVKEIVHPAYVDAESRGGLGWLEGFNELICRCGLESHGAPGEDTIIDNNGNRKTVVLPLHGSISNTPALRVWVTVELQEPYTLAVSGEMYDARMFGPSYKLTSTVSTTPGSLKFRIKDEVENLSGTPSELELLYHCNFGPPLLGEGSRLLVPVRKMSARDQLALDAIDRWDTYGPPEVGFVEQCYFFTLHGDEDGSTAVGLVNPDETLAVGMHYSLADLPTFTVWKNTAAQQDGYVTGLEPGTDMPNPRMFERKKGRVITLDGGGTYCASLEIGLERGAEQVQNLKQRIEALSSGKESEVAGELDPELTPLG